MGFLSISFFKKVMFALQRESLGEEGAAMMNINAVRVRDSAPRAGTSSVTSQPSDLEGRLTGIEKCLAELSKELKRKQGNMEADHPNSHDSEFEIA